MWLRVSRRPTFLFKGAPRAAVENLMVAPARPLQQIVGRRGHPLEALRALRRGLSADAQVEACGHAASLYVVEHH